MSIYIDNTCTTDLYLDDSHSVTAIPIATRAPSNHQKLYLSRWLYVTIVSVILIGMDFIVMGHIVSHLATQSLCGCGDPGLYLWVMGYDAHHLFSLTDIATNYPFHANLMDSTFVPFIGWLLAPITLLVNPIASFNVAIILGPLTNGFAMLYLLRVCRVNRIGSVFGSILFAFNPAVIAFSSVGDLNLTWLACIPMICAYVIKLVVYKDVRLGNSIWLGIYLSIQVLISTEVLAYILLAGVATAICAMVVYRSMVVNTIKVIVLPFIKASVVFMLIGGGFMAYALYGPNHTIASAGNGISDYGNILPSLLSSPATTGHASKVLAYFGYSGGNVLPLGYIGAILVGIILIATILQIRNKQIILSVILGIFFVGCSLGAWLLSASDFQGVLAVNPIWLPWSTIGRLPLYSKVDPARLIIITWMYIALFVGLSITNLSNYLHSHINIITGRSRMFAVMLLASLFGLFSIYQITYTQPLPLVVQPVTTPQWFKTLSTDLPSNSVVYVLTPPTYTTQLFTWQSLTNFHLILGNEYYSLFDARGSSIVIPSVLQVLDASHNTHTLQRLRTDFINSCRRAHITTFVVMSPEDAPYLLPWLHSMYGNYHIINNSIIVYQMRRKPPSVRAEYKASR